ncbi:MAG: hypothetical protein ABI972_09475 [Acidobacteriota bacterium]
MKRRALLTLLLALIPFLAWRIAEACAPVFAVAVFHYKRHPDFPRGKFINGNLGVIQPTWARSYLVLSYRYLSGVGLDTAERDQARDYYKDRQTQWWDRTGTDWVDRWRIARARVPGIAHPEIPLTTEGKYSFEPATNSFELNCAEDAYRNAVYTLEDRARRFGISSPAVREWTSGQNAVFANCSEPGKAMPTSVAAGLPTIIQADRAYQIAAAHFYSGHTDEARRRFTEIARDPHSPWATISHYLVLRTIVRTGQPDASLEPAAEAILADPKLVAIHSITVNLIDRHAVEQDDLEYFHRLGRLLARRAQGNGLRDSLWNYTQLYDHFIADTDPNPVYEYDLPKKAADPAPFTDNDLSLWVFHFQRSTPASGRIALERWQKTHSAPWLIAALTYATPATATPELLEAARAVPANSPAYFTAAYHYNRLLIESKDKQSARAGLDALLAITALDASSASRFRDLRLLASPNLPDFLRFAVRSPLMITTTDDAAETPLPDDDWYKEFVGKYSKSEVRVSPDAARAVNGRLSQRQFTEAALDPALPAPVQREFLMTAFTRAVLLELDGSPLLKRLIAVDPKLSRRAEPYLTAANAEDRRFAAVMFLLRQPEAHPMLGAGISRDDEPGQLDSFRDNWWCPLENFPDATLPGYWRARFEGASVENLPPPPLPPVPAFATSKDVAETAAEHRALAAQPSSLDFLGGIVLAYANAHPQDPRIPESLHLIVRGARVSCSGKESWKTTRTAFRLLHARYPKSEWAAKTETWWRD